MHKALHKSVEAVADSAKLKGKLAPLMEKTPHRGPKIKDVHLAGLGSPHPQQSNKRSKQKNLLGKNTKGSEC